MLHQDLVITGKAYDQVIVDTPVMRDAVFSYIDLLATCSQHIPPFFIQRRKLGCKLFHKICGPLTVCHAILVKVSLHLSVSRDINETEHQLLGIPLESITNVFDLTDELVNTNLICKNERIEAPYHRPLA